MCVHKLVQRAKIVLFQAVVNVQSAAVTSVKSLQHPVLLHAHVTMSAKQQSVA